MIRVANIISRRLLNNPSTPNLANVAMFSSSRDSKKLDGKVAIVTASTEGIGFSIAKKLAQDGASVVISSRKEKNVKEALASLSKDGLKVFGTVCHVAKGDDRKKLIDFTLEKTGGIDILVSNAGVSPSVGDILDTTEDAWDKIFDINVKSAFMLTKEIVPHIEKRKGGTIIYISSITGYQPFPLIGAYSVSKTTLLGLTKVIADSCAPKNIRVNCVAPGMIQTKFSELLWTTPGGKEELDRVILQKRIGKPEEIGNVVSFLVSDDASYITGESIVVAGGYYSRL